MKELWDKLFDHLPLDAAADQMGIKFHHDALPPVLLPEEATKVVSYVPFSTIVYSLNAADKRM